MTMIKLDKFFKVKRGDTKNVTQLVESNDSNTVRLISATHFSNGGSIFYIPTNETVFKSGLTINNNGSVGDVFFHNYSFTATSDVTIIIPKDNHTITLLEGLYLKTIIEKQKSRFMYGYKISNDRLKNMLLDIPINIDRNIDWKKMNDTMSEFVNKIPTISKTQNKISSNSISLNDRNWKQFEIKMFFDVYSGKDLPKYDRNDGNIPFIGSSSKKNGVTDWIDGNANKSRYSKNSIGVNRNGSVGYAFYHPYTAYFSGDTRFIKLAKMPLTPKIGLFISTVISQQKEQFGYGFKLGSERLKRLKINLPVDKNEEPDWQFMEDYIKSLPNGDLI